MAQSTTIVSVYPFLFDVFRPFTIFLFSIEFSFSLSLHLSFTYYDSLSLSISLILRLYICLIEGQNSTHSS